MNAIARKPRRIATSLTKAARTARAFSLLENTIAIAILGIGLIMVAAAFPVALTQHRVSTERAAVLELLSKAEAMLDSRYSAQQLWVDPAVLTDGVDSPWYMLPTVNVIVGANDTTPGASNWDAMAVGSLAYADVIDGVTLANNSTTNPNPGYETMFPGLPRTNPLSTLGVFGLEILSDRLAPYTTGNNYSPFTDAELMERNFRFVWYGFYRRLASGGTQFAAAVCKQRQGQVFAEQDLTVARPFSTPAINSARPRRFPVPWRVSVAYLGGNVLTNNGPAPLLGGTLGLADVAPVGTKLMVSGGTYSDGGAAPMLAGGRMLTVSDTRDAFTVEFIGDSNGLPLWDTVSSPGYTFDVWVFPPAVLGNTFERTSPLIDWKVGM